MKPLILLLISTLWLSSPEKLRTLKPKVGEKISFDKTEQSKWEGAIEILYSEDYEVLYANAYEEMKHYVDLLEELEGPLTQGMGCSWYCGGGPYKIVASSTLDSVKYGADMVHDFNLFTGWVEGTKGYGIGETIEFFFAPYSARVNRLIFYNGYFKNMDLWKANSRVKKAKLYIDDVPYAILEFEDINAPQSFTIDPISSTTEGKDLVLKVEILEVYKGTKYDDVVISEINFDGLDVHCFAKGTQVLMADGSTKNIEDLQVGDEVATMDLAEMRVGHAVVERLERVKHSGLVRYRFESNAEIVATQDHPFLIRGKGWASMRPEKSSAYKGFEGIGRIEVGDAFVTSSGADRLVSIENIDGEQETYTISKLSSGTTFIANGMIVGVEDL